MKRSLLMLTGIAALLSGALGSAAEEPMVRTQILAIRPQMAFIPAATYSLRSLGGEILTELRPGLAYRIRAASQDLILSSSAAGPSTLPASLALESSKPSGTLTIEKVPYGVGWWWESAEDRAYRGALEVHRKPDGNLQVISILPLDDYLCGVVPSEIGTTSPTEALKAQAVAARSETLAMLKKTNHPGENFDLCADVHCQAYSGVTKETPQTNSAVRATRGLVLSHQGEPVGAYYASNCGGHSENVENVWSSRSPAVSYWSGHYDSATSYPLDLRREEDIRQWISMRPQCYCNPDNPGLPAWSKKYFRWERRVTAKELEAFVAKTRDIGRIVRMVPRGRGVSGRLLEMEFVGERGSLVVGPELAIRQVFSPPLYSAAFVVDVEGSAEAPQAFLLRGAGWGHGVGMCQTGAIAMAAQGKSFEEILAHYYRETELKKLY